MGTKRKRALAEKERRVRAGFDVDEKEHEIAETQAIGVLLQSKKMRRDILDGGYNRYTYDDEPEALPSWFVDDEAENNRPILPVTKEIEREYRRKIREINNRPTRKAAEAVGRRKMRLRKKLDGIQKQAQVIADSPDRTERAKAAAIRKLKNKVLRSEKRNVAYVMSRKTGGGVTKGTRKGNSKVKVVDKRLKADKRGLKAAMRKQKKVKRGRK